MITRPGMHLRGALASSPTGAKQIRPPIPPAQSMQRVSPGVYRNAQGQLVQSPNGQPSTMVNKPLPINAPQVAVNAVAQPQQQPSSNFVNPNTFAQPMQSQDPNAFAQPMQSQNPYGFQQPMQQIAPFQSQGSNGVIQPQQQPMPNGSFGPQIGPDANAQMYNEQMRNFIRQ